MYERRWEEEEQFRSWVGIEHSGLIILLQVVFNEIEALSYFFQFKPECDNSFQLLYLILFTLMILHTKHVNQVVISFFIFDWLNELCKCRSPEK